ncbi:hypothetical protein KEM52_000153 [Ascosphaera acerosa]|nr:hypothetical protein KEM52_000153 [Ascosphaera acerosa]
MSTSSKPVDEAASQAGTAASATATASAAPTVAVTVTATAPETEATSRPDAAPATNDQPNEPETIATPARRSPSKVERTQSSMGDGKRVYDIPTLMSIGRRLGSKSDPVVLNLMPDGATATSPAVPAGRRRGESVLKEKSLNRHSRGCSGSSTGSSTYQDNVRRASHRVPSRQPSHPPHGTLAQSNAGFAKFLKEHTSPKHQRVTAGGRIVPFEIDMKAAAPEFLLPGRKRDEGSSRARSQSASGPRFPPPKGGPSRPRPGQERTITPDSNAFRPKAIPVGGSSAYDSTTPAQAAVHSQAGSKAQPSTPGHAQAQSQGQGRARTMTFPNPAAPLFQPSSESSQAASAFGVGGSSGIANGNEQPTWPVGTSFAGMSQPPPPPIIPTMYNINPPNCTAPLAGMGVPALYGVPPGPPMLPAVMPTAGTTLPAPPLLQPWASQQALEEATKEYDNLNKELEDLDRYLAIRFQIDPTAKRILVEQRMELVEKKNAARAARDWIEQTLEISAKHGAPTTTGDQQISPQMSQPPAPPPPDTLHTAAQGPVSPVASWLPGFMPNGLGPFPSPNGFVPSVPTPNMFLHPYQPLAPTYPAFAGFAPPLSPLALDGKQCVVKGPEATDALTAAVPPFAVPPGQLAAVDHEKPWERSPENAPPEIMHVYRNLEDAVRRGADLEPHLQQLSQAIATLKHKQSVIQRQRTASRDIAKDCIATAPPPPGPRHAGEEQKAPPLSRADNKEKVQSEAPSRKPSGSHSIEHKRRFRGRKRIAAKQEGSQASRSGNRQYRCIWV